MNPYLLQIAGWGGAAVLLAAFVAHSLGSLPARTRYHAMNLVGAFGVATSSAAVGAYPAAALNACWMLAAAVALARKPPADGHAVPNEKRPGVATRPPALPDSLAD